MDSTALCFGAHPDDIVIGCGATVAALTKKGTVAAVTFTAGMGGSPSVDDTASIIDVRQQETDQADKVLGIERRFFLDASLPQMQNDDVLLRQVIAFIRELRPALVFCHAPRDWHRKHGTVSRIVEQACWQAGNNVYPEDGEPWRVQEVLWYEVLNLFPRPTMVVDVTQSFEQKLEAIRCFDSQLGVLPGLVEYAESLGRCRGFLAHSEYAEAFMTSRSYTRIASNPTELVRGDI
ncbi:MAG: PIG-L family deacetylase [Methanopyri archaeon]|nr:PIG-L family deacetylase [Methanopyri archaeon]